MATEFPATFDLFLKEVKDREPVAAMEEHFKAALNVAAENPVRLYHFFQRYNYLNAQIASTIASLVGNIGKSRDVFIDPEIPVLDEADYAFEVAHLVQQASTDEYADPKFIDENTGEGVSHRLLATGLLKAVGDYAHISPEVRRNFVVPVWLRELTEDIQKLYSGEKNDMEKIGAALGAHVFSEWSADNIEFSNAARTLFIKNRGQGFDAYLQQHPKITVQKKTFLAHSWLKTHGGYNDATGEIEHGVEYVHLETGYRAAALMISRLPPEKQEVTIKSVFDGLSQCRGLLDTFFLNERKECAEFNVEMVSAAP